MILTIARQIEVFERDLNASRRVSYDQWRDRPLAEKIRDTPPR